MNILENVSLKLYSTMRLGGTASYLTTVKTRSELEKAADWAEGRQLPMMVIGIGSNIVWRDEGFKGLVVVNRIPGFKRVAENEHSITLMIGAGKSWDKAVAESVALGLSGIEALSLIPGTTGATPVQNVGAYGQEIADTLEFVEAYDRFEKQWVVLLRDQCGFGYRTSRFKTVDKGRFLIASITIKLSKHPMLPPFYDSLQQYFVKHNIKSHSPANIRKAVIAIRTSKLPDPEKVANNGSFFANPIVDKPTYKRIRASHMDVKAWETHDGRYKIAAGWLVEKAGFKGVQDRETGMATWKDQALVLVNEKAQRTSDLLSFRQKIIDKVQEMFGVVLDQEPELLP
jgi:UDP-N-acetylmuramate dehydrogenase